MGQEAVEAAEADVVPIETDRQEIKERAGLNKGELHDNQVRNSR